VMLLILALACGRGRLAGPEPAGQAGPGALRVEGTMVHEGLVRSYRLRIPKGEAQTDHPPLVLALHGGGGNKERMCDLTGGLADLVDREGFLLLCPQGVEGHWNDGRGLDRYRAQREAIDDVGFLRALARELSRQYEVAEGRVYVTGASNGGMMTYRLACEAPELFAAAASIIANLPKQLRCQPSEPISMLIMNGTEDPLMPYDGGQVRFLWQELGAVHSTMETAARWAETNGCQPDPTEVELPEEDPEDGTLVQLTAYSGCDRGSEVVVYTIVGGGHTWPGGNQYAFPSLIGPVSREGHMGEIVWDFFARH
jgi:polyhydroxybutyrate depolymerase